MKIRPIASQDKAERLRMRSRLWPESPDDHVSDVDRFFSTSDHSSTVLVAERPNGSLCGFLEVGTRSYAEGWSSSPVGFIEGWWVDSDARRQSIGSKLVAAAESWARSHGPTEMASDAELTNEQSHSAHKSLGYEEVERLVCFRKSL